MGVRAMNKADEHRDMDLDQQNEEDSKDYVICHLEKVDQIRKAISDFDKVFSPALSERISDLDAYAEKLQHHAIVYVARSVEFLGLLAFYANDSTTRIAYLTQIAVQPNAQNKKIGKILMDLCIKVAKRKGMIEIILEVHKCNVIAIRFYEKNGFEFFKEATADSMYMKRKL